MRFKFTNDDNIQISCDVKWDNKRNAWIATNNHGFYGVSRHTRSQAALACFTAWMGGAQGWFDDEN